MEKLYSYKGSYPYPLPKDMTNYRITDFALAPEKPKLKPGEQLEWIKGEWVIRPPNNSELEFQWQRVRDLRSQLLSATDIKIIQSVETQQPIPEALVKYRQSLRDITLQPDPFNIVWPSVE